MLDAANFLAGGAFDSGQPASWNEGDFGYDGVVDILDAAEFVATGLFDVGPYNSPVAAVANASDPLSSVDFVMLAAAATADSTPARKRATRVTSS